MTKIITKEDARAIGEGLIGSCTTLSEEVNDAIYNVEGFAEALDDVAVECAVCGWWVATDDLAESRDENICSDCGEHSD